MSPVVLVAILSFAGIVTTAIAGIIVAVIANRSEKNKTAETTLEKTLRERLTLRDEQLADKDADLVRASAQCSRLEAELMRLQGVIEELRENREERETSGR